MENKIIHYVEERESLPPEILFEIFLQLDNQKDLLNAKLVNKTWYSLIAGKEEILEKFAKALLENLIASANLNTTIPTNQTYKQMIAAAKRVNVKLNHPRLERSKITLRSQLSKDVIVDCSKQTLTEIGNKLWKRATFSAFGNPTPKNVTLVSATYLGLALLAYVSPFNTNQSQRDAKSFYQLLVLSAYLAVGSFEGYKLLGILMFTAFFFTKLRQNYVNSQAIYQQDLLSQLQNTNETGPTSNIKPPIKYLTISWQRENILSSTSKEEVPETEIKPTVSFNNA